MKRLVASLSLCLAAGVAQAELWGYVDGAGVAHFASEQLDSRYSLLHGEQRDPLRVPGKTDGSASLLTWLDIAPEVKAVQPARERLLDARLNILIGARMLADLTRRFGRIDVALAAWNAGEGAVHKHGDAVPPIAETEAHVHTVLELYWALLQRSQRATQLQMHESPSRP